MPDSDNKPASLVDLTQKELEALDGIMKGKNKEEKFYLDEAADLAAYFLKIKLNGTIPFRLMHSPKIWTRVKKEFSDFGIDIEAMPATTDRSEKSRIYRTYKNQIPLVTDLWSFFRQIPRRGNEDIHVVDDN